MTENKPAVYGKVAAQFLLWQHSFFVLGLLVTTVADAQFIPPDAGQLLEQQRRTPLLPAPIETLEPTVVAPAVSQDVDVKISVGQLRIVGSTAFSTDVLHALVSDGEGRSLSLSALQALADRITHYYRERGYILARALIPTQQPKDDVIDILVIEGRIGEVIVNKQTVAGGAALAPLARLKSGDIARSDNLEQTLLILSDLPGVAVSSTLKPGSSPGTSDLVVDVTPGAWISASVDVDANGDRYSGRNRTNAALSFNNPLHLGDQAFVRAGGSNQGMRYVDGNWELPVNRYGTRIGATFSNLHYELGDALAPLGLEGEARQQGLFALHPVLRSRRATLNASFSFDHKEYEDRITAVDVKINKRSDAWSAGLQGAWIDNWQGSSTWDLKFTRGHLWLDPDTAAIDAVSAATAGNFSKWNLRLERLQRLTSATNLLLTISGQLAGKNLDSSVRMGLGGFYGVRAYPQSEAVGDQGYLVRLELQCALPYVAGWQGTAFVDHGHIDYRRRPWAAGDNSRSLSGAGVGLNFRGQKGWSFQTAVAWRVDTEQPLTDRERMPRLWLSVGHAI